jgi:hypothetical protein
LDFGSLREYYEDIYKMAVDCLEKLPDDKLDFKAHPELRTPGELFFQMYVNQDWYINSIMKGGLKFDEYKKLLNMQPSTKGDLRGYIDRVFKQGQEFLQDGSHAALSCNTQDGTCNAYELMLRDFGIQYYYLGQIFVLFRLMDLMAPEYGETLKLRPQGNQK